MYLIDKNLILKSVHKHLRLFPNLCFHYYFLCIFFKNFPSYSAKDNSLISVVICTKLYEKHNSNKDIGSMKV